VAAALLTSLTFASCGDSGESSGAGEATTPPADGTGYLTVGDLPEGSLRDHFGTEGRLTATLQAHKSGCVNVVVDGVERVPLWPDGSSVAQVPGKPDAYLVTLPGGMSLSAGGTAGDSFTADGLIASDPGPFTGGTEPPGKVDTYLAFCAVDAAPVAVPDDATVSHQDGEDGSGS